MRETDVEVIHFPLHICNSLPSLPESRAGPEDLSLPLARGDGISRADSLQLGPAWHWEGAPAPTPRGLLSGCPRLAVGKFCLWPMAHLLPPAVPQPMFSRFLGMMASHSARNQGGWAGSLLPPTCPLSFWSLGSTPLTTALPAPGDPVWACHTILRDKIHGVRPGFSS